ncbi:unnamed protein product [Anisakis simplex]|uniref:Nucleolin-like n=1 Tax=Anisakis simplex TaxID=6269 RepID=A0A0M3JGK7_ANISI|nr:unnamed protein product [Anisakis simplex]
MDMKELIPLSVFRTALVLSQSTSAEGLSPAPESKHPRNEEDNSSKANDKNVFVDLINSTNKTEVELKGKKKKKKHSVAKETAHVVHKKVVSGGKIVELDENEENDGGATDDHSKGDDALIVDNLVSLDEPEKEGGDEDQEVSSDEDEEVDDEMTSDSSDMTTLDSEGSF